MQLQQSATKLQRYAPSCSSLMDPLFVRGALRCGNELSGRLLSSSGLQDRWEAFKERRRSKAAQKQPFPEKQQEQPASKQGQVVLPIEAGALQTDVPYVPDVPASKQAAVSPSLADFKGPPTDKATADGDDIFAGAIPPVCPCCTNSA